MAARPNHRASVAGHAALLREVVRRLGEDNGAAPVELVAAMDAVEAWQRGDEVSLEQLQRVAVAAFGYRRGSFLEARPQRGPLLPRRARSRTLPRLAKEARWAE